MGLQVTAAAPGMLERCEGGVSRTAPRGLILEPPPLHPRGRGLCILGRKLTLADPESPPAC
eukprot:668726-Lingulodinium_polyedra.AAC.1